MNNWWLVTYEVDGVISQQPIQSDGLWPGYTIATRLVSGINGATLVSVSSTTDPNLMSGMSKLVNMGLTEDEAAAIANPSPDDSGQ